MERIIIGGWSALLIYWPICCVRPVGSPRLFRLTFSPRIGHPYLPDGYATQPVLYWQLKLAAGRSNWFLSAMTQGSFFATVSANLEYLNREVREQSRQFDETPHPVD